MNDVRLAGFIAAVFPDAQQSICLRAFKAKDAPDDPVIHPLSWQVTKAQLLSPGLQKELFAANETRGIYFVVNSGGNKNEDIAKFNALFVEIDMPEADWRDETRRAEQIAEQKKLFLNTSLKPSIMTETLRGLSAFWLIEPVGTERRSEWKQLQTRLIEVFGADTANKNEARCMRLPFFNHVRFDEAAGKYQYRHVPLVEFDVSCRYSLDEMHAAFASSNTSRCDLNDGLAQATAKPVPCTATVSEAIADGSRHKTLVSLAGSMRRRGMSAEAIYAALKVTNETQCQPPLDEQELVELCQDIARRYAPENSRAREGREQPESSPVMLPVLSEAALYGVAGETVRTIEPHTEADNAALLIQLLAGFGSLIGKTAYFRAEADYHYTKLFAVLVGQSSKGRKGSSWGHVHKLLLRVEEGFRECVQDGLSSGEGLIAHVRDVQEKLVPIKEKGRIIDYQREIVDEGAIEKRAFIVEPEFSRVLRAMQREGNTLSSVIRQAWDSDRLRVMTKTPMKATEAHISIVGHITLQELTRNLDQTDTANGFANRFLWIFAGRSKFLPEGGNLQESDLKFAVQTLRQSVVFARQQKELKRDSEATKLWRERYRALSMGHTGLFGAVTSRAEAQVMRLASIYALLDKSPLVRREHLEAAFALWQYAKDSARYIFGTATGNKLADEIFAALEGAGEPGLTRTDISNVLGRNRSASEIERALRLLFEYGKARTKQEIADDAKRPTERWYALTRQNEINETNELIAESEPLAKDNFVEIVNFVEEPREDIPRTEADLLFDSKPIVEDIATADTAGQPSSFPCWECGASCSSEDSHCPSCDHDLAAVPF